MIQYIDLMKDILNNGHQREDRTKVGTISVFGRQIRFNLQNGFPAVTTKSLAWRMVVAELLWFLEGSHNIQRLAVLKNDGKLYSDLTDKERFTIWDANYEHQGKNLGYKDGELGPIYGKQWRDWTGVEEVWDPMGQGLFNVYHNIIKKDQIKDAINLIKNDPTSRRIMVTAWNPSELDKMTLPPCHYGFQFYVDGDVLNLMWNQRSVDVCTGLPFNIASYGLLLCIVAKLTGLKPGELIGSLGDCHIYNNHIENALKQVERPCHPLPVLEFPDVSTDDLDTFLKSVKVSDFKLIGYVHEDQIKYPMAV